MADNCYGEFLDVKEPTDVGVDVMAGSLIKNPAADLPCQAVTFAAEEI